MTTPADPDVRRFRLVRTSPAIIEPDGRRLVFDPLTFQGATPSAAVLADHLNSVDRVAGRLRRAWTDARSGSVLGTAEIFADTIPAAARVRTLLNSGHRAVSIRYHGERRPGPDHTTLVTNWTIGHLAVVGEPADEQAGPMDDLAADANTAIFNLEILPQEGDMTTLQDIFSPQAITDAVEAGVRAARIDEPEPHRLQKMLAVVATQPELYNGQALGRLALAVAAGTITDPDALQRGIEDALLPHKPQAAGLADDGVSGADYSQMLCDWWAGKSLRGDAWQRTEDILGRSEVSQLAAPGAIPMTLKSVAAMRDMLVANTGSTSAGDAVDASSLFYDATVRDPLNLWDLIEQVPGGSGEVKMVAVTMPTPGWQAEPSTDAGYTKSIDPSADENSLSPKILLAYVNVTRLMDVLQPQFWAEVGVIAEIAMMEQINRALIETASTDAPTGMYDFTDVGTSANLTAAPTAAVVGSALQASALSSYGNRRMVMQHGVWQTLRALARPAGVAPLVDPAGGPFGTIDNVPLEVSGLWTASKPIAA